MDILHKLLGEREIREREFDSTLIGRDLVCDRLERGLQPTPQPASGKQLAHREKWHSALQ